MSPPGLAVVMDDVITGEPHPLEGITVRRVPVRGQGSEGPGKLHHLLQESKGHRSAPLGRQVPLPPLIYVGFLHLTSELAI